MNEDHETDLDKELAALERKKAKVVKALNLKPDEALLLLKDERVINEAYEALIKPGKEALKMENEIGWDDEEEASAKPKMKSAKLGKKAKLSAEPKKESLMEKLRRIANS